MEEDKWSIRSVSFSAKNEHDLSEEMNGYFEENDDTETEIITCQYQVSTYNEPGYDTQQWHFALVLYKIKL